MILSGYARIGRPQDALQKLDARPLAEEDAEAFVHTWQALIIYARVHDDWDLLRRLEPIDLDRDDQRSINYGIFFYLLELRAFAEAEVAIQQVAKDLVPYAYGELARAQMGISTWEHRYDRMERGF